MATSSLNSFEKKEKTVLVNVARAVGSALGTVAAKTSAVTKPSRRRKAVRTVKVAAKKQVAKARGGARKVAGKVESSARKVRRKL
jgi:hypothetical protein